MGRRNALIIVILLIHVICFADAGFIGEESVTNSISSAVSIFTEDFEAIADGEDWLNDGDWLGSAGYFEGDSAQAHGGTLSGLVTSTTGGYYAYRTFTEPTGYIVFDFWLMVDVTTGTVSDIFVVSDGLIGSGTYQSVKMYSSASGYLQIYANTTLTNVAAISADTWTHVEVQVNAAQSDGIGAIYIWVDNTQYGPYDTYNRLDPAGMDRMGFATDTSSQYWVDDIDVYEGTR